MTDQERLRLLKLAKLEVLTQAHKNYVPNGRVETFINAFGSDQYFVSYLSAANGVGKTCGVANLLANLFWPCENPYFQGKLFLDWPYIKKFRIVSTPTGIVDNIVPKLKLAFPAGQFSMDKYKFTKGGKQYDSHLETNNGWEGNLMTYEQALPEFEGSDLGLVWFDEPSSQAIYEANVFRLRTGGRILYTATPLTGSAWMYDKFLSSPDAKFL